jgi:hypothetical protein
VARHWREPDFEAKQYLLQHLRPSSWRSYCETQSGLLFASLEDATNNEMKAIVADDRMAGKQAHQSM